MIGYFYSDIIENNTTSEITSEFNFSESYQESNYIVLCEEVEPQYREDNTPYADWSNGGGEAERE